MTSAPRVERVDDLVVDSQGLDPPTEKWLQAAREAADTDGIRENAYAERLQMCISCCTLMCMFPMVPNMYRVSHSRYVSERVSPSYSKTGIAIGPFYKNMESLPVAPVPPKSLPRHSRGTPEALPSSSRAAPELAAARRAREPFFGNVLEFAKNRIRTLDPEQRARGETHQAALLGLLHREYWGVTRVHVPAPGPGCVGATGVVAFD